MPFRYNASEPADRRSMKRPVKRPMVAVVASSFSLFPSMLDSKNVVNVITLRSVNLLSSFGSSCAARRLIPFPSRVVIDHQLGSMRQLLCCTWLRLKIVRRRRRDAATSTNRKGRKALAESHRPTCYEDSASLGAGCADFVTSRCDAVACSHALF